MDTDTLNTLVTDAIWRVEELDALGIRPNSLEWARVSALEEELAKAFPASDPQGRVARRGAITAALKARDYDRVQALLDTYLSELTAPDPFKASLSEILREADQEMASRFQNAAALYTASDARSLARRFREAGAFGLAA